MATVSKRPRIVILYEDHYAAGTNRLNEVSGLRAKVVRVRLERKGGGA
jgi:hypothetical protein